MKDKFVQLLHNPFLAIHLQKKQKKVIVCGECFLNGLKIEIKPYWDTFVFFVDLDTLCGRLNQIDEWPWYDRCQK